MNMRIALIISLFSLSLFFSCKPANTQDSPKEQTEAQSKASKSTAGITSTDVQGKQKASQKVTSERKAELIKKSNAQKAEGAKQIQQQKDKEASDTKAISGNAKALKQPSQKYPFNVKLADKNGKEFNSKDVIGKKKPTAILFWLTTCPPCKMEMAAIKKKYASWKEEADFDFIAVSMDWEKNHEKFRAMAKEKDWPWDTYIDLEQGFKKIMPGRLNGLPQSFVFDSSGEVVYHKRKYRSGDEDQLFEALKNAK